MKTKLLAACTAAAAVTGPLCAEELVYGTYAHSEHYNNRVTAAGVFDRVAAATNGDITVKIMSGGVVAGAKETLEAIQTGLIDMGAVITTYNAGDLPATQFIGNFHTTDQRIAAPALTETVLLGCPQCTREAVENGVSLQLFASSVPAVLLCASKPVETLADLAGMRVRASGAVADRFAAMGAVPVIVSPSEIYEALQRGNVDCHSVALTELENSQLWDVVGYATELQVGTYNALNLVVVNQDTWQGFTPEQQELWRDALSRSMVDTVAYTYDYYGDVRNPGCRQGCPDPGTGRRSSGQP